MAKRRSSGCVALMSIRFMMRFLPVLRGRQRRSVVAAAGCHLRLKPMTSSLGAEQARTDDRKRKELPERPMPRPSQGSTRVEAGAHGWGRGDGRTALLLK